MSPRVAEGSWTDISTEHNFITHRDPQANVELVGSIAERVLLLVIPYIADKVPMILQHKSERTIPRKDTVDLPLSECSISRR